MAGSRVIKNRIKSTKSIGQITKAMEAVSAVKMRKSEQSALRSRPYALSALGILRNLSKRMTSEDVSKHPFMHSQKGDKKCLIVITSDRGLAGSFNSNVIKRSQEFIAKSEKPVNILAVGKKGRDFFHRRKANIVGEFLGFGDFADIKETNPIAEKASELFLSGEYSEITAIYTNFRSALKQDVILRKLLPVSFEDLQNLVQSIVPEHGQYSGLPKSLENSDRKEESYVFEPSAEEVLGALLPELIRIQVFHSILEANASEHSSRMIAMRNATDNASELIGSLTIKYNKMRQDQITKELIEITAGTEALAS